MLPNSFQSLLIHAINFADDQQVLVNTQQTQNIQVLQCLRHGAIVGGYVYRGCAIPDLFGTYFYADFCTARIWSFRYDGASVSDLQERTAELGSSLGGFTLDLITSFGQDARGELYVCEDETPGRVFHVDPLTGLLDELAAGLAAPEGLAFGDFGGAQAPALYAAESKANRIVRLLPDGSVTAVGNPSQVSMTLPDNVEFGPDGFLYVAEDRDAPDARILRIAPDGRHTVVATGFDASQGMAFDPTSGDLYISEQNANRVWRLRFAGTPMPGLVGWTPALLVAALVLSAALVLAERRRAPSP